VWEVVDCIQLVQDMDQWRDLLNTVMNLRAPKHAGNFLSRWVTIRFWRRTLLHGVSYV